MRTRRQRAQRFVLAQQAPTWVQVTWRAPERVYEVGHASGLHEIRGQAFHELLAVPRHEHLPRIVTDLEDIGGTPVAGHAGIDGRKVPNAHIWGLLGAWCERCTWVRTCIPRARFCVPRQDAYRYVSHARQVCTESYQPSADWRSDKRHIRKYLGHG